MQSAAPRGGRLTATAKTRSSAAYLRPDGAVSLHSNYSKKHHYNAYSSNKQCKSQTLLSLTILHPHNEACGQQRKRKAADNNAKCDLSD